MGKPRLIDHKPYPVNYGMIPRTVLPINLGGDGDPLDAIVLGKKIPRGMVVEAKILGLLSMKDMGEVDDKIITVHKDSKFFKYNSINDLQESNPDILKKIIEWFLNYKGKSVVQFRGLDTNLKAIELIKFASKSFERYGVRSR